MRTTLWLGIAFLIIAGAISQLGSTYLEHSRNRFRTGIENQLKAITELKVRQIVEWREERLGDAHAILVNPLLADDVERFLKAGDADPKRGDLLAWLDSTRLHNQSRRAVLLDAHLAPRLASPSADTNLGPTALAIAARAIASRQVILSDLHHSQHGGYIHLDLEMPLYAEFISFESNPPKTDFAGARLLGVLDLEVDPYEFLYPLLQDWPTPSQTAETLLVRREADQVLFLNELRHQKGTALALRMPLALTNSPAVTAVLGQEGAFSGTDYRQQPVLADIRRVPGTDWFLIAKIDQQEIFAPFNLERRLVLFVIVSLLAVLAMGFGFLWRLRENRFLRQEMSTRARMEAAVRQSEEKYRLFLQNFQGVAYQLDMESNSFVIMQGQVESLTGYSPEDFMTGPLRWLQLVHPEDLPTVTQAAQHLMTEPGHVANHTYRIRRRDGELRWINDVARSATDPATGRRIVQGAIYDVTKRKQSEESLRLLSAAVEQSSESIMIMRAADDLTDSKIIFVNCAFSRSRGYASEEVVGKTPRSLGCVPTDENILTNIRQALARGEAFHGQAAFIRKNGTELEIDWMITPLRGSTGEITHFVSVQRDVTERNRAQREHSRLATIIEASPDFIGLADGRDQHLIYLNRAGRLMAGVGLEEDVSRLAINDFVPPANKEMVSSQLLPTALSTGLWTGEAGVWHRSGREIPVLMSVVVHKSPRGDIEVISNIAHDISNRKKAETELKILHQQLVETARQAGMAEVATSVLHNVGNVLNSINITSSLLLDKHRNSSLSNLGRATNLMQQHRADLADYLTTDPKGKQLPEFLTALAGRLLEEQAGAIKELMSLQEGIEHIKQIVAMQQSYARVAGITESLMVDDLVEDALRMAGKIEQFGVNLVRQYAKPPPVHTEKHKVIQILVNLISNAKNSLQQATQAGKRLLLRTESLASGRVRICVADNGMGIAPENRNRIFEMGFTTRKNGHGFGLHNGALVARELGGSLSFQSDGPGCGATFILELPSKRN